MNDFVSPCDGGCWFCNKKTDSMSFDCEFDTFYHSDCLDIAVEAGDPEAYIMANVRN